MADRPSAPSVPGTPRTDWWNTGMPCPDFPALLERVAEMQEASGNLVGGVLPEFGANAAALRQLAGLLREITPGRVFGVRMQISGAHYAANHEGPSRECPDEVCAEMTALYNAINTMAPLESP